MVSQPSIEVMTNVEVTARFDPPQVRPGEKSTYRITVSALTDSVQLPEKLIAPPPLELQFSARGQTLVPVESKLKPQTAINYHARANTAGTFVVPEFEAQVYGQPVKIPAARLEVLPDAPQNSSASLEIDLPETNIYVGQAVNVRVLMRASPSNSIQAIQDMRFNGEGFLVDQGASRQTITMLPYQNRTVATYVYESRLTPLTAGSIQLSAQGFTAGNRFSGAIRIQGQVIIPGGVPQFVLLDSDPVTLQVRPLPRSGELPGFTGMIGALSCDSFQLSTNRVRVGELVKLSVTVRGDGNLARLVPPPPPLSSEWQVFAAETGGPPAPIPGTLPGPRNFSVFTYTLIPLSKDAVRTPAIPFSCFDPKQGAYVDLTIPPLPITVLPGNVSVDSAALAAMNAPAAPEEKKLKLSDLAVSPGWSDSTLQPLQQRRWFVAVQLLPLIGFVALWQWDRRRRFLEQHPEIVRRRQARRALRHAKREIRQALNAGDATGFSNAALHALRIIVAPHYPAEPQALVSRDVLQVLGETHPDRQIVQRFFSITDAAEFSGDATDRRDLLGLQSELDRVLNELEAKL